MIKEIDRFSIVHYNKDGLCHRENNPAFEWRGGTKIWYQNNKRHRLDGPANEYPDGVKFWCINNTELSKKEFNSWILRVRKCI